MGDSRGLALCGVFFLGLVALLLLSRLFLPEDGVVVAMVLVCLGVCLGGGDAVGAASGWGRFGRWHVA